MDYQEFLRRKIKLESACGFEVDESEVNQILKPHQRAAVIWALRGGRRALFEAFGLGKTVQQLEICRLALEKLGSGRALIVAPLGVRQEFKRDAVERLGWQEPPRFVRRTEEVLTGQMFSEGHDIYLTNYESVRDGKLNVNLFDVVCLDEASCFPAGTPIETPNGLVPIERVKIGDEILNANGKDRVKDVFRKEIKRVARIKIKGEAIFCSDNHRFFTKRGWVRADELIEGDAVMETAASVQLLRTGDCAENLTRGEKAFLQQILLSEMASSNSGRQRASEPRREAIKQPAAARYQSECTLATAAPLRMVYGDYYPAHPAGSAQAILQQEVLRDLANAPARHSGEGLRPGGYAKTDPKDQGMVCVGLAIGQSSKSENRTIESDVQRRYPTEGFSDTPGARRSPDTARRQRQGLDRSAASPTASPGAAMGERTFYFGQAQSSGIADTFLRRLSPTVAEDSNRSGRFEPSSVESETARLQERCLPSFSGVDSVEILECGHPDLDQFRDASGKLYFYDLTATQHPSFSVSGLLVHNCLRGFGGTKTFREFMGLFAGDKKTLNTRTQSAGIRYRFVATATPSPNDYIELLAYAAFLGVMDVSAAKTRFFKRDSTKADKLTIHPHKEREFWLWVSSWALFLQSPADLGFDATGYDLPPLRVIKHEVGVDHSKALADRSGQHRLFREANHGVVEAAREKRDTLPGRIEAMKTIIAASPDDHFLLWHDLEAERLAIEKAVPSATSVYGSQDLDQREQAIIDFSDGRIQYLAAKPVIAGSGCNFQRHCHKAIFLGIGFKFNDFIQAIMRIQRFLQTEPCEIHLIYAESERSVLRTLERKWEQHNEMVKTMSEIIQKYGLSHEAMAKELTRGFGVERIEIRGENHTLINNDSVLETANMQENSVGLILTSIPFSTQYEYSPNYADFGHSDTNDHFFSQMDYLTPNLLRVLQPGRIAAIHVKDRIVPGGMTGLGFQVVYPFHARCIEHYTRHGFAYMGMKTIVTDVVRENNQTYRLGWTEQCKDGTKMGVGMPEYLLLFRKPPTDTSNSYADLPVVKSKERYSRSRWQIDAHGFTRSSGERLLTPEELHKLPHSTIFKLFRQYSLNKVYDFEYHVALGEALELMGKLPVTFMLLQPQSWAPDVWTDITRMLTLNGAQSAKGKEMHLCPMQFDLADRVIAQLSMPGETVLDPFGGLMTVPYRAIRLGRKGIGIELSPSYFTDGAMYCEAAERENLMPGLFDALGETEQEAIGA